MLKTYFDSIFCINLERRKDRYEQAVNEFKKYNMLRDVEFVTGVDGSTLSIPKMISADNQLVSRGDIGCAQSHLKVAKLAKVRGLSNYLVFEDDVELHQNFNELLPKYMQQVPADCQFLYFGGNHNGGFMQVTENIVRIYHTYTTHAYAVRDIETRDKIIEVLSPSNEKVDIAIASLHHSLRSYCFRPHLAFQQASYSDILEQHTDYQHLRNE